MWFAQVVTDFFDSLLKGPYSILTSDIINTKHYMFPVLLTVPFFSAFIAVLAYSGCLQTIVKIIAIVMEQTLGTTVAESVTCMTNCLFGMVQTPFIVHRYLSYMTKSELHAMMVGGLSTVAIFLFQFLTTSDQVVHPIHLLSATLMSSFGALALSKLFYPEIEHTSMRTRDIQLYAPTRTISSSRSYIESAFDGAILSITVIAHIIVSAIAVISTISLLNAILSWLGYRAGFGSDIGDEAVTLDLLVSFVLWPIIYILGVPFRDCYQVSKLVAVGFFATDPFIPFHSLGKFLLTFFSKIRSSISNSYVGSLSKGRKLLENYHCEFIHGWNESTGFEPIQMGQISNYFYLPATNTTIGPLISVSFVLKFVIFNLKLSLIRNLLK